MNRDADHPTSSEVGEHVPPGDGDDGDEELEMPLDALLDWGKDPTKGGEELGELEAQSAEALVAAERDEYLDSLRRLQADFDNFRKRSMRQQTELLERATEGLCIKLLPVLDALDLATAHLGNQADTSDGGKALAQIDSLLRDILAREGVERIDAIGVLFDPTVHDAVGHVPTAPSPGPEIEDEPEARPTASDQAAPCTEKASGAGGTAGHGKPVPKHTKQAKTPKAPAPSEGPTVAQVMRAGYKMKSKVLRPAMVLVGD